ncbi:MAG TPA: hypothetical protein VG270_01100 [Pseudolabrys sp.]|nr:hypothetical protein [Pseudolabrys sp.]
MAQQDSFVLQKVQPALLGLMDGAVSTPAPLFAAAGLSGKPPTLSSSASHRRQ